MPGYVYVSYSRADAGYVTALVAFLAEQGVTAWADPEPESLARWEEAGRAQLDGADAVVVVMSPASGLSPVVGQDIGYAGQISKPVAPLLLGGHIFPQFAALPGENVGDGRMPSPDFVAALRQPATAPVSAVSASGVLVAPAGPNRRRTGLWVRLAAAATALVLVAGGGVVWWRTRHGPPEPVAATPTYAPSPAGPLEIAVDLPFGLYGDELYQVLGLYLDQVGNKAGVHAVELVRYDNGNGSVGNIGLCRVNARQHQDRASEVAILGTGSDQCTREELIGLKQGEAMLTVSPWDTHPGLTRSWNPSEPGTYQRPDQRTFARVIAPADSEGGAMAVFAAEQLRVKQCYVMNENNIYGSRPAAGFAAEAAKRGLPVVGPERVSGDDVDFTPYFEKAKAAGADCVYVSGAFFNRTDDVIDDKMTVLGPTVPLLVSTDFSYTTAFGDLTNTDGIFTPFSGLPCYEVVKRSSTAATFLDAYAKSAGHAARAAYEVIYAVQALQVILAAIEASDGSRHGVLQSVFSQQVRIPSNRAMLGRSLGIDPQTGDPTLADFTIVRMQDQVRYYYSAVTLEL